MLRTVVDPVVLELVTHGGVARLWRILIQALRNSSYDFDLASSAMPARIRRYLPYNQRNTLFFPSLLRPSYGPSIQIVHDCIKERYYPGWKAELIRLRRNRVLQRASLVIAVSHTTHIDIGRYYGDAIYRKTKVIYNPVDFDYINDFRFKDIEPHDPARPFVAKGYVLYVGTREGCKNFKACRLLLEQMPELRLLIVGPKMTWTDLQIMGATINRCYFTDLVDDGTLYTYMSNCSFLFFPSLWEGFGYPLVEAKALGAPVVCLSTPSNYEIGGDAIITFELDRPSSLRDAVKQAQSSARVASIDHRFDLQTTTGRYIQSLNEVQSMMGSR